MSKKAFLVAMVILALLFSQTVFTRDVKAQPGTIIVPDNYPTIQTAIDNAHPGDTVFVRNGTYYFEAFPNADGIVINKSISLVGESSVTTFIRPHYQWLGFHGFPNASIKIESNNVSVSGFTIDGGLYNGTMQNDMGRTPYTIPLMTSCIEVTGKNCSIFNNVIMNGNLYEVYWNGNGCLVSANVITATLVSTGGSRSDVGVYLSASDCVLSNNTITETGASGIRLGPLCSNVTIAGNSLTNSGSSNITTEVHDPYRGGIRLECAGPCEIYQNNIKGSFGYGILFDGTNNSLIYNNNVIDNGVGVQLENYVISNVTKSIGSGNVVFNNNFVDNTENAFVQSSWTGGTVPANGTDFVSWDNGQKGNYWSDYLSRYPNASQVDNSGTWNIPYEIYLDNVDNHSLMDQVDTRELIVTPAPSPSVPELPAWTALPLIVVAFTGVLVYARRRRALDKTE